MDPHDEPSEDPEIERVERRRLGLLDAVAAAVERRVDVLDACFKAADEGDAVRAIAEMLSVSEQHAQAVIDTQFRRLTGAARRRIDEERDDIRSRLTD